MGYIYTSTHNHYIHMSEQQLLKSRATSTPKSQEKPGKARYFWLIQHFMLYILIIIFIFIVITVSSQSQLCKCSCTSSPNENCAQKCDAFSLAKFESSNEIAAFQLVSCTEFVR